MKTYLIHAYKFSHGGVHCFSVPVKATSPQAAKAFFNRNHLAWINSIEEIGE